MFAIQGKIDRRKSKTKRSLRKAMLELIAEHGVGSLTVSALTERAELNRGTFYLHYRDGADLLESVKRDIFEGLAKRLEQINPLDIKRYAEKGEPYPVAVKLLGYFEEHADFFDIMLGANGDPSLPGQIRGFITERLYEQVFRALPDELPGGVPKDYLIAYMTSANLGLLLHWFATGRRLPSRDVAMIITRIMYEGPLLSAGLSFGK
ncbi:TetR/AcrR family transcriptional regulator [Paenibacillus sp.]|uniref:TetR/AcrR family transcriptional regulator n=1 Tax=Paenibacillus sp. TaxID=58172 RepID=UPI002D3CA252|nr:TetR/AcrR family transcriptional regulator [Paenibacillus sp.]HZG55223.1 TetR/AcrR family transcriptional regulator [Paenibacillus sp.]